MLLDGCEPEARAELLTLHLGYIRRNALERFEDQVTAGHPAYPAETQLARHYPTRRMG
jgi:hypothetical protein